jgi:dihydropyrimidinase
MKVDYNPYEGRVVKGVPTTVISRGNVIVDKGQFLGKAGDGKFVPRKTYTLV